MTVLDLRTARSLGELTHDMMKNQREWVRVLSGFQIQGREPAQIGEELQVSRSFAAELVSSGKAERIPAPPAQPPADLIPQIQSPGERQMQVESRQHKR